MASPTNIKIRHADVTVLENASIDFLIETGDSDAALLWLYLIRVSGAFDLKNAASVLRMDEERVKEALSKLQSSGAVEIPPSLPEKTPEYTAQELAAQRKDPKFSELCTALEAALGRILKKAELQTLLDLYKRLSLSCGTIMMLIQYLGKTPEKRLTIKELEREACRWADAGVTTEENAEEHLKLLLKRRTDLQEVMRKMKLFDRLPSPSEEKYINDWLSMGFSPDVIESAYDKTVMKTGSLAWKYLNKILETWHSKGLHTVADIQREDSKAGKPERNQYERSAPKDVNEEYISRVKNYLKGRKGGL